MFEKVFYSIAHFVFILHLLFACVLWLRAHGSARLRAMALLMGLLSLFFLLKLWAFGLPLHPLDLRPTLVGGLLTLIFCLAPRLRFTSPREVFHGSLCILIPALFPFVLCGGAVLAGVHFRMIDSISEVFVRIGDIDVWLRLLAALPVFWYSVRSFRMLKRMNVAEHPFLPKLYACGCVGLIPCFLAIFLDGSILSQLCVQLYSLFFNGVLVYSVLFDENGQTSSENLFSPCGSVDEVSVRENQEAESEPVPEPVPEPVSESVSEHRPAVVPQNPLFERLEHCMQYEEPWRNPELTLADVVSILYTNRTSLTQAIREAGYGGFKDYVGFYRIREFKRLVANGKVESLEQGFRTVGFRSKTTAFRHFSRFEEKTPLEYLRCYSPLDNTCKEEN